MAKNTKTKNITVSIELGKDFIKVAGAAITSRGPVFRLIRKEFSSEDNKVISREIADLFKTNEFSSREVFLNIPRHLVMSRVLRLPSIDDDEIKDMVKLESAKRILYKEGESIVAHRIVGTLKDGYSDVLMAIVQGPTVKDLIDILKKAGLTVDKVALGSESLFGWYSMIREKLKESPERVVALVNIDPEYVDINIVEDEKLVFTRAFLCNPEDIPLNKDSIGEIKKSITTYHEERGLKVDSILISGAENKTKASESSLKKELSLPVKLISQTKAIKLEKGTKPDLGETSFIELIGLSVKNEDMKIDLLPESLVRERSMRRSSKSLFKVSVLLACVLLVSSSIIAKKMFDKFRYFSLLDSRIEAISPRAEKAQKLRKDIEIIKDIMRKKPLAIEVVAEICVITPDNIFFELIDYDRGKTLILKGYALSLEEVVKFTKVLEASRYFENAKVKYTSQQRIHRQKKLIDFEITCALSRLE
jgi:Tfp pilus assembly PilM family ATPase/Tfp pilus assembly protein PilN